jgi:hypothetical protein
MGKIKDFEEWKVKVPKGLARRLAKRIGSRKRQFILMSLLLGVDVGNIPLPEQTIPAAGTAQRISNEE